MNEQNRSDSLLEMARGAILERVDYEAARVAENIEDPNTDFKAKRKIQITLTFKASADRETVQMETEVKTTLAPMMPVSTSLYMVRDDQGDPMIVEAVRQTPGQLDMDGGVGVELWAVQGKRGGMMNRQQRRAKARRKPDKPKPASRRSSGRTSQGSLSKSGR